MREGAVVSSMLMGAVQLLSAPFSSVTVTVAAH